MAFAAARMIMPKEKVNRKPSAEFAAPSKNKSNLRPSRSPSLVSTRSGFTTDSYKNKPGIPRSASGRPLGKPPTSRGHVKHFKKKGKKGGKPDLQYDLIVNIDLEEWQLTDEQVAEYKEVFMLFDKDEDGVLTFQELNVVMKSLGQRPSEKELLRMVREVSEDRIYDTIEFNEFLQMMSKQMRNYTQDSLRDAFRIFDKDDDGLISVDELRHIMLSFGEKMSEKELDEMISEANCDKDGHIDYEDFVLVLCNEGKKSGAGTRSKNKNRKNKTKRTTPNAKATSTLMSTSLTVQSSSAAMPASSAASAAMTSSASSSALRPHLTTSSSYNGNLMASLGTTSQTASAAVIVASTNLTTVSIHHSNNINVDKKNNNAKSAAALPSVAAASSSSSSSAAASSKVASVSSSERSRRRKGSIGAAAAAVKLTPSDHKNINLVLN